MQLGFSIGMRNTDTEFSGGRSKSSTSGRTFSVNLNRSTEWGGFNFNAGQQLNPASTGEQQQSTTISAGTTYNINERWYTSVSANYLKSTAASGGNSNGRTYATLSPALSWRWTPETKLELSYNYRQQTFDATNESSIGNGVQLQFSYQPQINHQVK
jgi:long-subunit fatty acid transport protein